MIIKGASRRSIGFWSRHLADTITNERVELIERRGLAAPELAGMMREMRLDARLTRARNFMYIASFNPCRHEHLTETQWDRAFQIFENHRGIPAAQQRFVVEHAKNDRVHRHVVWNRIDTEQMRAFPDGLDFRVCEAASEQIERELGLEATGRLLRRPPGTPRPPRNPKSWEMSRAQRSGLDPRAVAAEVSAIFQESDGPADFVAGLRAHGYEPCQGDRRAFCLLDPSGDVHSLARRILGLSTKALKVFLQGLDLGALPSLDQAKARYQQRKAKGLEADPAIVTHMEWEDALARVAISKEAPERRSSATEGRAKETTSPALQTNLDVEVEPTSPSLPTEIYALPIGNIELRRVGESVSSLGGVGSDADPLQGEDALLNGCPVLEERKANGDRGFEEPLGNTESRKIPSDQPVAPAPALERGHSDTKGFIQTATDRPQPAHEPASAAPLRREPAIGQICKPIPSEDAESADYDREPAAETNIRAVPPQVGGTLRRLFRQAMQHLTVKPHSLQPQGRRRRTEDTVHMFRMAARKILRRTRHIPVYMANALDTLYWFHLWNTADPALGEEIYGNFHYSEQTDLSPSP